MTATNLNLVIEQGATFSQVINVGAALVGVTPTGQIRASFGGALLVALTCTAVTAGGDTTISLTATQTAALSATGAAASEREVAIGVWDLETLVVATVVRHRQGRVILIREAST